VSSLCACPRCGGTEFLQVQHGYVYWGATIDTDGDVDTSRNPWDFGDADTVGYECRGCDFTLVSEYDLL
jgi:hypothetical protein